jgi:very-short-patch-repair endonuclease
VKPPSDEKLYAGQSGIDLSNTDLILPETTRGWSEPIGADVAAIESAPREETHQPNATYFFPLPYNDEQFEIIRCLEKADGVVVQGPPGTGKTHTIANIICHYLATQRRVLVTAKTPEALTALREKLPEGIADLAIAVIHNDREGARQLEKAVAILANEAKQVNPRIVGQEVREKQARLVEIRSEIARIDHELHVYAERNLSNVIFRGEEIFPMELAARVFDERPRHMWFEDELALDPKFESQFDDADVAEMRRLRAVLGTDIAYAADDLPKLAAFPQMATILAIHGELARMGEIDGRVGSGELLYMSIGAEVGLPEAHETKQWLENFHAWFEQIQCEIWLLSIYHNLLGVKGIDEPALTVLRQALADWIELHTQGLEFRLQAINFGDLPFDDQAFDRAVSDLAAGRKPFGLFSLFKGGLKERIEHVQIEGRAPASPDDWQVIREYRVWHRKAREFIGRWDGVARGLGVPALPSDFDAALPELSRLGPLIEALRGFVNEAETRSTTLSLLFPYGIDPKDVIHHGRCEKVLEALTTNLEKVGLAETQGTRARLQALIGDTVLPFHAALSEVMANLGNSEVPQAAMAQAWQSILDEAARLDALRDTRLGLDKLADKVAQSGASVWARRLCQDPVAGDEDRWTPITWRETWEWARASGFIRELADRNRIERLAQRRAQAEHEQKRLFADIVRLRTFLGLKDNLTARVEAALQKFVTAIGRLGRGTGKAATRRRRIIRDAAIDAAVAVPCWILPEWRVSEQLPPDLGAFDLVIIDEASQSDITALPAVLRGKQLLIVGDDKQVSPSTVGLEDRKIVQLRSTYLANLPLADQMEPAISLYELGSMVFPGKVIMLREHFRCVEPIIRFSSRFYAKALIPLRVPTPSERLDPPLVDIYVPHGQKRGDLNNAEADVVVREIRKLAEDSAFAGRSIGVISLIGDAQAKLIYTRLVRELGAEVMERHRIMCGSSATFQGQERDIMFLSMVACPATARTQTSRIFEQRFNVALSRARDRMVLVRSVATSHLKPGDLKLAAIEHFRNPMGEGHIAPPDDIIELCESGFERAFGKRLIDLGYRIRPQVRVAGKRIDFVIDGNNDRRLAIELDGDKYHGPDRWAEDFRRQKALERLGWTFWRCWGSSWIADPDGCLIDLQSELNRLGIEPLGTMPVDGVYTLHVQETVPPGDVPTESILVPPVHTAAAFSETASTTDTGLPPSLPASDQGHIVEPGDTVVIRYNDAPNRPIRVELSREANRPESGLLHVSLPLAQALLGNRVDDEVEVQIDNQYRKAVIERIDKPA